MSAACGGNSESELGNVKERLRDYYVSRDEEMSAACGTGAERVLWTQKRGGAWGIARSACATITFPGKR